MDKSKLYCFPPLSQLTDAQCQGSEEKDGFRRLAREGGVTSSADFSLSFSADPEAEKISEVDIEKRIEQIREKAYADGFSEGEKAGAQAEKMKCQEALETLYVAVSGLDAERREILADAERQAVELGIRIARKILCREVSIDEGIIFQTLKEALKRRADHKTVHVKVNPSDLNVINTAKDELAVSDGKEAHVLFESDTEMCRGECMIETDFGVIDARFESQMQAVEESLRLALAENEPGSRL